MSYILDALRKSETERRQGRVPDLGQQMQLIHKPKKRRLPIMAWVAVGLILNAAILAWVFWPGAAVSGRPDPDGAVPGVAGPDAAAPATLATGLSPAPAGTQPEIPGVENTDPLANAIEIPMPADVAATGREGFGGGTSGRTGDGRERPTVIVPTSPEPSAVNPLTAPAGTGPSDPIPHLVELPLSFQKRVPDLVFNSHIFGSRPSSRRVMINDHYLRAGESFSGITVERITEEGVELSMDGRRFRVGVVRNWVSPD